MRNVYCFKIDMKVQDEDAFQINVAKPRAEIQTAVIITYDHVFQKTSCREDDTTPDVLFSRLFVYALKISQSSLRRYYLEISRRYPYASRPKVTAQR